MKRSITERIQRAYDQNLTDGKKLEAFGILLCRQAEYESFIELEGLGMLLCEIGRRMARTARSLDLTSVALAKKGID